MSPAGGWVAVLVTAAGCYGLKLGGLLAPRSLLDRGRARQVVDLFPVALLAALVAVQTFATGRHLTVDARVAGLVVAAVLVALRAPFLVVVVAAAGTAALLRAVGG